MPITPMHLLVASPVKALVPHRFSLSIFPLTNLLIDLEPITCFVVTLEPRHLFFHTIIGATLMAFISATYGIKVCAKAIDIWNDEVRGNLEAKWLTFDKTISKTSAWISALIGAWSHLLLDSFMHNDIKPLSPFTDANLLLGTISVSLLHSICLGLGLIGILMLIIKRS